MTHLNGKAQTAEAIRRTLDLLFEPDQVIELRVLVSKKQTDAGYFTDRDKLITAALGYDGKAPQYVVANSIDPRLVARYTNRIERYAPATTGDKEVIARRWLPIEFDPDRPSGIPASDAEHAEAHERARDCAAWLSGYGWPQPIVADSGNGAWLLYKLPDLPNTPELTAQIKRCLAIVSLFYEGTQASGIAIKVDATVFNAARLVRLFGTINLKGDGDAASGRRNRASSIVEAPEPLAALDLQALDRLLGAFPEETHDTRRAGSALNGAAWDLARVEAFISAHQLDVAYDSAYDGGHKWVLGECPFNAAHTDKSAVITWRAGRLGFRCHHNGCTGNDWKTLRALLEPDYANRGAQVDTSRRNGTAPRVVQLPSDEPPHPAEAAGEPDLELETEPAPMPIAAGSSFPELPEAATVDEDIGADACPWLDEYIAFSRRWSPRSYDGFHEACGLWVLSTVAARRVMLPLGGEKFTPLYIALCARTSLWAKSTAAKIAKELIVAAGLSQLLAPDKSTPQSFLRRLAERAPADYGKKTVEEREAQHAALAFAGQRGWWYEEFGGHLAAMMRDGNVMADFRSDLRALDDCPARYEYDTVQHGLTIVKRPYLALLAVLTPADLAPHARKGSSLWGDGYFARFAFITPQAGAERSRARFPEGWRTFPPSLLQPLRVWHEHLGIPTVEIDEQVDEKGKATGVYSLKVEPIEPERAALGAGVFDAYYRYKDALDDLIDQGNNADLDGSYSRFADKALRIAVLLASFSNGGRIELAHWARAQAIAERWRRSLHHLVDQLGQSEDTPDRVLEDKLSRLFARHPVLTAREAGRFLHISTGEAERLLDQLLKAGELQVDAGKRTKRYRPAAATVASVAVSHVSHPAQSCDTSVEAPRPIEEVSQNLSSSDTCDIVTVATLPQGDGDAHSLPDDYIELGGPAEDDHTEALVSQWIAAGNLDAADAEAELINDLERKLAARLRVDRARAAKEAGDTATSLRLRLINPALYEAGWRAIQDGSGYRLIHPAAGETGLFAQLEAAARAAADPEPVQRAA